MCSVRTRNILTQFAACQNNHHRRDDLESLAYAMLEMWEAELVWDVTCYSNWPIDLYLDALANQRRKRVGNDHGLCDEDG